MPKDFIKLNIQKKRRAIDVIVSESDTPISQRSGYARILDSIEVKFEPIGSDGDRICHYNQYDTPQANFWESMFTPYKRSQLHFGSSPMGSSSQ
jgi:hypothetical protein